MRLLLLVFGCVAACAPDPELGDPAGSAPDANEPPMAQQLLARIATCHNNVGGPFAQDRGMPATISLCGLGNAVTWTADLDVVCDGKTTAKCNAGTDPSFGRQTAASDSVGGPLDAAALPFVVIPARSPRFDFTAAGLRLGSVVAVVFGERLEFGVIGDVGPASIIGEASYRMAESLGIDPHPASGGTASGVTYIAFTGAGARVAMLEDHDAAVEVGLANARGLLETP